MKSPFAYFIYATISLVFLLLWLQIRNKKKQELLAAHEEVKFRENRLQLALIGSNSEVWDWQAKDSLMFGKRISQELAYIDLATAHTFEQHVELIHPDDKDDFLANWRLFVENNDLDETFSCTYRLKHADGHWLWYKDLGKIVTLDHQNNPSRITGSYTNITKTRAEEVRSQYYGEAFKQTNDWVDQIGYHGFHDRRERRPDDDTNCHVHDIALGNEVFEFLKHFPSLFYTRPNFRTKRFAAAQSLTQTRTVPTLYLRGKTPTCYPYQQRNRL